MGPLAMGHESTNTAEADNSMTELVSVIAFLINLPLSKHLTPARVSQFGLKRPQLVFDKSNTELGHPNYVLTLEYTHTKYSYCNCTEPYNSYLLTQHALQHVRLCIQGGAIKTGLPSHCKYSEIP